MKNIQNPVLKSKQSNITSRLSYVESYLKIIPYISVVMTLVSHPTPNPQPITNLCPSAVWHSESPESKRCNPQMDWPAHAWYLSLYRLRTSRPLLALDSRIRLQQFSDHIPPWRRQVLWLSVHKGFRHQPPRWDEQDSSLLGGSAARWTTTTTNKSCKTGPPLCGILVRGNWPKAVSVTGSGDGTGGL